MEWETKKDLYRSEKLLMKVTLPLGYLSYQVKKRKNPSAYFTVGELFSAAGLDIDIQSDEIRNKVDDIVSGVCRIGSRFTKGCICVQLYEDAIDLMRIAIKKGALFCITNRAIEGVPCVVVENPIEVYADMCRLYYSSHVSTTAIVGSIGKTTTKKMVQCVYQSQVPTFCDAGNDNQLDCVGYIGQHIPADAKAWIQEVSEDTRGCVEQISKIIQPNIAIITAVDKSHIEEFGDEQGIYNEISSITSHMPEDGICIVSIDEENTAKLIKNRKTVTVSTKSRDADFYATDIEVLLDGLKFKVLERKSENLYDIHLKNAYARHNVYSALYAFAAGVILGISYDNIIKGLQEYKPIGIRQNVYKAKGITVYADCYNAVAKSVRSAINATHEIPVCGKRVAVLGDIAETGAFNEQTHDEIIDIVNSSNFNVFFALGNDICSATNRNLIREDIDVVRCSNRSELNKKLKKCLKKGDLVLFKASHSMMLEKTIKKLFPMKYALKKIEYYWPQIIWRMKVLFN